MGSPEGCGGWTASSDAELDALLQRMSARAAATDAASMTVLRRRRAAGAHTFTATYNKHVDQLLFYPPPLDVCAAYLSRK